MWPPAPRASLASMKRSSPRYPVTCGTFPDRAGHAPHEVPGCVETIVRPGSGREWRECPCRQCPGCRHRLQHRRSPICSDRSRDLLIGERCTRAPWRSRWISPSSSSEHASLRMAFRSIADSLWQRRCEAVPEGPAEPAFVPSGALSIHRFAHPTEDDLSVQGSVHNVLGTPTIPIDSELLQSLGLRSSPASRASPTRYSVTRDQPTLRPVVARQ